MRLYNTMSRTKDEFEAGPVVALYVCGVTPYDTTHLGHAFSYAAFDVLIRTLRYLGHEVRYTQNVTDIDDDILKRSKSIGVPWDELGREQTELFQRDMSDLNVLPPTHYPRATEEIPGMVDMIQQLVEQGNAYQVGCQVYFAAATAPNFGMLARLPREEMLKRFEETGDSPNNPEKRDKLDFLLWKGSAEGEPSWDSPWGAGRPGWHIECSTMAVRYLGPRIDIHGGGDDLIFPHHSCEIAQSEQATGQAPFSRIWMHNGVARLDGVKMSKSLGNLVMVRELLGRFSPDAIRLYLLRHHYRDSFDYDEKELVRAANDAALLQRRVEKIGADDDVTVDSDQLPQGVKVARRLCIAALVDDLNTPDATRAMMELATIDGDEAGIILRQLAGVMGLRLRRS
ncbi:MAG: cysteinyl-tRNA synthetase [Chloroflexi bacterium]|nr:cysteinyl-tRNA synthetase [Chloroflexota bacterium]